jgi:hypothetical protein
MSNNSDMIRMLRLVEGQQFAGLPEQRPGDQVRGTERAKKNGQQHPFHNRLVGEEISLEDKLAKKYQDMKDLHGKEVSEMDKSEPSAGRDTGPRTGPDRAANPITAKQATDHAAGALSSAFKDSQRVDPRTDKKMDKKGVAEGNMPQSVIKSKQKYADMTAQEFHAAHKNKSAAELQAMAWRHGYGKGSNHYVDKHKKGSTVTEGQEEIEYICSGCSGSGEGPHEGTTCRTCHGSGVEMGYADEPEHEHDEEELDEDQHESPMERPMLHRIMMRHMDLIEKYGLDRVLDAVRDVADGIHIGPDDEIGTSDVSAAMVNVMNQLKSSDHTVDEESESDDELFGKPGIKLIQQIRKQLDQFSGEDDDDQSEANEQMAELLGYANSDEDDEEYMGKGQDEMVNMLDLPDPQAARALITHLRSKNIDPNEIIAHVSNQTLDEYGSLPGTSAEPVAGTTAPSSGASTSSSTPADEPASGGSPNNTTLSSPGAAGAVSAGGSAPTTPSTSAGGSSTAKPAASTAPQPNVPDVPITPDEKAALDRIRANAGLKTQFDNLLKQVQPKVQ